MATDVDTWYFGSHEKPVDIEVKLQRGLFR